LADLNYGLRTRRFELHPELSGFLLIHSTVFKMFFFVMCNILYYRFAVLAQLKKKKKKLIFSFFL